jgi:GTP cyclohydrolase IA
MTTKREVTWAELHIEAQRLADRWAGTNLDGVYGVPTGGAPVAVLVATILGVPLVEQPVRGSSILVVDDLVDSGETMRRYNGYWRDALYRKPHSPKEIAPDATLVDAWLTFPWERDAGEPTDAVTRLLEFIGEDPTRPGVIETPRRVVKALREMTAGLHVDPTRHLAKVFREEGVKYDEMIVVSGIEFTSICEHHLLPFTGTMTIAYIPDPETGVVGLSKLPRMALDYAQRPQVQERLTRQVAEAMMAEPLNARGAGVIIRSQHSCMAARGIKANGLMTTSALMGLMFDDARCRSELMQLSR